jgi:hypothetical protein
MATWADASERAIRRDEINRTGRMEDLMAMFLLTESTGERGALVGEDVNSR